jgi:peptide/nickel transport system permease protein
MVQFFAKRIGVLLVTMLLVSFILFLTFEFSSGDQAISALGQFATKDELQRYRDSYGLDRSFFARYFEWLGVGPDYKGEWSGLLQGNLGYSHLWRTPVNLFIWDRLRNTTVLAFIAFLIIAPLSVVFGVVAGMREGSILDRSISVLSTITTSVPEFATGVILMTIFASGILFPGILPGTATLESGGDWSVASQLVLPVATLTTYYLGYLVRMVRASMVEVMQRAYIRTAVLKGLTARRVILRHAVRNAMINPVTIIFLQLTYLISGLVVVEIIFAYPGFGRMMLEAALFKDIAVLEVGALVAVFVAVMTQILADLAYMTLDPRIRT